MNIRNKYDSVTNHIKLLQKHLVIMVVYFSYLTKGNLRNFLKYCFYAKPRVKSNARDAKKDKMHAPDTWTRFLLKAGRDGVLGRI